MTLLKVVATELTHQLESRTPVQKAAGLTGVPAPALPQARPVAGQKQVPLVAAEYVSCLRHGGGYAVAAGMLSCWRYVVPQGKRWMHHRQHRAACSGLQLLTQTGVAGSL